MLVLIICDVPWLGNCAKLPGLNRGFPWWGEADCCNVAGDKRETVGTARLQQVCRNKDQFGICLAVARTL